MGEMAAKRPKAVTALIALTAFQALGAIGGGVGMIQDPVKNIGMPLRILDGSPFSDYFYPGIILLTLVGLLPLVPLVGLIRGRVWGWWFELAAAGALLIWIVTEVAMLGYLPGMGITLQTLMGAVGIAELVLVFARPTRRYFRVIFR